MYSLTFTDAAGSESAKVSTGLLELSSPQYTYMLLTLLLSVSVGAQGTGPNGYIAVAHNDATFSGSSVTLSGSSQYLSLPSDFDTTFQTSPSFTIVMRLKFSDVSLLHLRVHVCHR